MKLQIICTLLLVVLATLSYSQDIIVLKTGDEIKAKVLEVTSDQVKYKKWGNQNGPIYSSAKVEIFMVKYANGSKDVFNTSSASNSNLPNKSNSNSGTAFIGTWYPKKYDGNNIKTTITITKPGDDYLVNYLYKERESGDDFYLTDGSFKEMGHIEGNNLIINSFFKLSLINESTILFDNKEFTKTPKTENLNSNINKNQSNIEDQSKNIKDFIVNQFNKGFPEFKVFDNIGKELNKTLEKDYQQYYHVTSIGESKYITVTRTWHFKACSNPIKFIIKHEIFDMDYSSPAYDNKRISVGFKFVHLTERDTNYSMTVKIDLKDLYFKKFRLSEEYFYFENKETGIANPSLADFFLLTNADIKLNSVYSKADLEILSKYIDTNSIENVDKSYFLTEFSKKSFLCKEGIRFKQSNLSDDLLIGLRETCDDPGKDFNYMYFKGIVFRNSLTGGYLLLYKKTSEGVNEILYNTKNNLIASEINYKKRK